MLNSVCIMGRLTGDPQARMTQTGYPVCNFTVACNRPPVAGRDNVADFIDAVAWRNTADFVCKHFGKGDPIIVQGRLQTRNWQDQHGNNRKAVEILVDTVHFCGSKNKGNTTGGGTADTNGYMTPPAGNDLQEVQDEDMPF